jgi:hypothetical protein
MSIFKVWFDYEEEDFVEIEATTGEEALQKVADKMVSEHGMDMNGMIESLNYEEVL